MRLLPIHNPAPRFERVAVDYDDGEAPQAELEVHVDSSRSILSHNESPDLDFRWSVNPYRGCFHACAYCYARPTHEYLGFGAGTDFDRKIVIKPNAPALLREAFRARGWKRELVVFSGVTDCYQPLESKYRLTRGCLEVCVEEKNPALIITKSPLVERDIDLLVELGKAADIGVSISIPFFREDTARAIEPFVTTPARRLRTVERLAAAGIRVGVNVAPFIPGISENDMLDVLTAAKEHGAKAASYVLLRLPGAVERVFIERLFAALPDKANKVVSRIHEVRGGRTNDARFGVRGRGQGAYADAIGVLFDTTCARLGLESKAAMRSVALPEPAQKEQLSLTFPAEIG